MNTNACQQGKAGYSGRVLTSISAQTTTWNQGCILIFDTLDIKLIKNLLKFDLIYEFLKSQIETCYIFGPIAIVKATLGTQLVWCLFQQNY